MLNPNKIAKRFGLFLLLYFGLIAVFQWQPLQKAHSVYYCSVGDRVFNLINPNYFANFVPEVPPNPKEFNLDATDIPPVPPNQKGWNTTIGIYNRAQHNGKISNKYYRNRVRPNQLFYRDFYELTLLPSLFILSLYLCTPVISWKKKALYFVISLLILYVFLSFHYSHIIENININNNKIGDDFWSKFIAIFGFRGLTEPLYMISIVTWAILTFRPALWTWLVEEKNQTT
jgi:hypothetical protein